MIGYIIYGDFMDVFLYSTGRKGTRVVCEIVKLLNHWYTRTKITIIIILISRRLDGTRGEATKTSYGEIRGMDTAVVQLLASVSPPSPWPYSPQDNVIAA